MIEKTEPQKEQKQDKKPTKKPTNRKLWCILGGGGCCLLLLILIILSAIFPFLSFLKFTADTDIPLPNLSNSPTSTSASPTPTPRATTQNQSYPDAGQCDRLELVSSVPVSISPSDPGLKQDIDTHYYQVYGYTPNEVRAQLNECGAKSEGEGYDAYTSYYINWKYNLAPSGSGCQVEDAVVGAKIDFFYPKWEDPGNAQAGLVERWQTYMANLITHEEGHKDIALAGAQAILDALSTLPSYSTCDEVATTANDTGNSVFADYDARNKSYDNETNHGETQGAVFP